MKYSFLHTCFGLKDEHEGLALGDGHSARDKANSLHLACVNARKNHRDSIGGALLFMRQVQRRGR